MTEDLIGLRPQVSVIICVRNGGHLIGAQLAALAQQTASTSWEVVVADNGSSDDTVDVVRSAADGFPVSLRVFDASGRVGICHARNIGASAARGSILAFCDCDDEVAPGWVQAAANGLDHADVLAGGLRELTESSSVDARVIEGGSYIGASFGGAVIGCNFAVRRDAYFEVGGFDESLPPYGCDDVEFSIRANKAGLTVDHSDDMVVHFRRTTGARDVLRKTYLSAQAEALVWLRHQDRYGRLLNARALLMGVLMLAPTTLRGLMRGTPRRTLARRAVTRLGNLVGYWRLVRRDTAVPKLVHAPMMIRELAVRPPTP